MFSSFVCQFIIVKLMTRLECQCQLSVCCVAVLTGKQLLETALWTPSLPPSPPHTGHYSGHGTSGAGAGVVSARQLPIHPSPPSSLAQSWSRYSTSKENTPDLTVHTVLDRREQTKGTQENLKKNININMCINNAK